MLKNLLLFLLFFCLTGVQTFSLTLKGSASYTVECAKTEAFEGVASHINLSNYKDFFIDKYYEKNIENIKRGKYKFRTYYISYFQKEGYCITYRRTENIGYYYNLDGTLQLIEFATQGEYPRRSIRYDASGKLDSTTLIISHNESYVFYLNRKLIAHWIGKNCYNEQGEIINTRK